MDTATLTLRARMGGLAKATKYDSREATALTRTAFNARWEKLVDSEGCSSHASAMFAVPAHHSRGEPYWSLARMLETMRGGVIDVQDAVSLAQLCGDCAGTERPPTVSQFLREPGGVAPDA